MTGNKGIYWKIDIWHMSSGVHVQGVSVQGVHVLGVSVCGVSVQGLFQGFITLIINIEGKYAFFVYFWHQTFRALVLDISILTLDMSVNNTSNSSIFHSSELG